MGDREVFEEGCSSCFFSKLWKEEYCLNKKLSLFALVAILVMAFAGTVSADPLVTTFTWRGVGGGGSGNWDSPANWDQNDYPRSADQLAVFPATTKEVSINHNAVVGAIRVDNGANAVFTIANGKKLEIDGKLVTSNDNIPIDGIETYGDVLFKGQGVVRFLRMNTPESGDPAESFVIRAREGAHLDFNVRVEAEDAAKNIIKKDKGVVAFTAAQMNKFAGPALDAYFVIQDGEVQIARADHMNNADPASDNTLIVEFNTSKIPGRSPMLTSTWSGKDTFSTKNKLNAKTNGTLNVSVEGSTFEFATNKLVVDPLGNTIKKIGPGDVLLSKEEVWGSSGKIDIAEGRVIVGASYAISGDNHVNVNVGSGTEYHIKKDVSDDIKNLTGSGTLNVYEGGVLIANGNSTVFPGKITGAGSIRFGTTFKHAANALITGTENDFTGDIFVGSLADGKGSSLTIEDAANLGGNNKWSTPKLYLDAVSQDQVTPANIDKYARLIIEDGKNFTLPNEVFIGDSLYQVATNANANLGPAVIFVPVNTQLTLAKNVTYNRNTLAKAGEGDIIMENLGYDSIGGANFVAANGTGAKTEMPTQVNITTAVHIVNGRVRIENDMAAAVGDIVVDSGTSTANRAILSLRNGLRMHNAIMFTAQSTFQTELKSKNLESGTDVQSAVEVGQVYYNRYFKSGVPELQQYTGLVYNRVNFDDLDGQTINKGNRFQLIKSTRFSNYGSSQVYPTDYDGLEKAPFDPYFSTVYLYFDALKTIDVPVIGQPSVSSIKPSEAFNFTVPVESVSGLKADSQSVFTTPAIADVRATIEGSNVRVRGTAPEAGQVTFRVRVSSTGDAQDVLEYSGERSFTLAVTSADVPDPEKPVSNVPAPVIDKAAGTIGATAYKFNVAGEPVINETLTFKLEQLLTSEARGEFVDGVYELTDITDTDGKASVTFEGIGEGTYSLSVFDTSGVQIGTTRTITDFQTPIDPVDPSDGGSSSGCDAGFGAFALLALGAAVVLRKKD